MTKIGAKLIVGLVLVAVPVLAQAPQAGPANAGEDALKEAEQTAAQAAKLADECGYVPGKVVALGWQAVIALHRKNWTKAEALQAEYAKAAAAANLPWERLSAATLKGRIAEARGDREGALKGYRDAVQEVEGLRAGLHAEAVQISFLSSKYEPYDRLIAQLRAMEEANEDLPAIMKMTAPTPAMMGLWYSEHVKARSLLDQMAGQGSGWRHVPDKEQEKVKPQEEKVAGLRQKLTEADLAPERDDKKVREARQAWLKAQQELERAKEKLILQNPRAAFAAGREMLPPARLDPLQCLLQQALAELRQVRGGFPGHAGLAQALDRHDHLPPQRVRVPR